MCINAVFMAEAYIFGLRNSGHKNVENSDQGHKECNDPLHRLRVFVFHLFYGRALLAIIFYSPCSTLLAR